MNISALNRIDILDPDQRIPAIDIRYRYLREVLIPSRLFIPCNIKILIVTDGSGSFDTTASFGLGHFLKAFTHDAASPATDNPAPYVTFTVKTAHRGNVPADFKNFKFDAHNLAQYDQIWLIGVDAFGADLAQTELRDLSKFMNEGGGVFATGDHEDLGVKLCGSVPRVRCMRRWYYNTPDPLGSPQAPPAATSGGVLNHNTITDNPATPANEKLGIPFQSDNYPQNIHPRYRRVPSGFVFKTRVFPHPVLCGPKGVIKVLPDHQHEGKCDIYKDFGRTLNFSGYSFKEFPNVTASTDQEIPEVIADNINQMNNVKFESISTYDGHKTDAAGRILCDATWHHIFNINLIGFESSRTRVRTGIGTVEDVRSEEDYQNIRAYFRNIAYWLARRSNQDCMRQKGYHIIIHDFDIKMLWKPIKFVQDKLTYFHFLGELAKDSLNHFASQCQWYEWLILWPLKDLRIYRSLVPQPPDFKNNIPESLKWIDPQLISTAILGRSIYDLFTFAEEQKEFNDNVYAQFDKIILSSREEMLKEIVTRFTEEQQVLQKEILKDRQ